MSLRSVIRARFRGDREQTSPGEGSDSSKSSSRECLVPSRDEQKIVIENSFEFNYTIHCI